MKNYPVLILLLFLISACSSKEEIASANVDLEGNPIVVKLYYENFMNADGLVKRMISIDDQMGERVEFPIHLAHYSDVIFPKILQVRKEAFLIAEDSTGYTVWDINANVIVAQTEIENNPIVDNPEGTGRDYKTHKALTDEQWVKLLNLKSEKDRKLTQIQW